MQVTIVSLAVLVACAYAAVVPLSDTPSFCKTLECPKYKVISSNEKYELRAYEQTYWVSTKMAAKDYWQNRWTNSMAFWRLFGYISGKNSKGMKMPMTAPVLSYHMKDEVVMAFMIPHNMDGKAPKPTEDDVMLYTSPAKQVYVKSYTGAGWQPDEVHPAKLQELWNDLAADNITISDKTFYTASYDGPSVKSVERYHEVWVGKP